jgi:superfamily II DNA/RNA helicase
MELEARGYPAQGLHGDMTQPQRMRAMDRFRRNRSEILVATDVAARGIDVEDIEAVFNYDLPNDEEYYVHRIGRTARAGKSGQAFSFVVGREIGKLREIEAYAATKIACMPVPSPNDAEELKASSLSRKGEDQGRWRRSRTVCTGDSAIPAGRVSPSEYCSSTPQNGNGRRGRKLYADSGKYVPRQKHQQKEDQWKTSGRTAKRRNWPRVQNRRSLDVRDVVQYGK